jgi:MFS family permease
VRLTPQRPSIPPVVRRPFVLAALAVLSSWSIGGLFFSLGPQLSSILFDSTNHLVEGLNIFVLAGAGAAAQLAFGRAAPWLGAALGSVALALGMGTIVAATAAGSGALLILGSIVAGGGFGVAFLGGLRTLSAAIPAEHRAGVMAAFYVVAYASLSLPAVAAGLLVTRLGVTETFEIFGTAIAGLALLVAFEAWRTRPEGAAERQLASSGEQLSKA